MSDQDSEVCEHLRPISDYYRGRGVAVQDATIVPETGYKIVRLDGFVYRKEILSWLEHSASLKWRWADPHYGEGNSVLCKTCKMAIEGKFDLSDPDKTLGE